VQWCFDKDGVPLRLVGIYTDANGTVDFRLEAASVSRTISDVDFEPLYPGT